MRCHYREKAYFAGPFLDVDIYPVFAKAGSRRKRFKPSTLCQQKLNEKNSIENLIRLVNANFTEDDMRFDLTYKEDALPEDDDAALRNLENYLRRLKRFRKRADLPALKYVAVTERSKKGRYHHHLIISGGVSIKDLAQLWGLGYTTAKPLQFDKTGISGLAAYIQKSPIGKKRYKASRNLIKPTEKTKDERLSRRKVINMAETNNICKVMEELYPGYEFVSSEPFWNDYNKQQYISVKMYIPPKNRNKRRNGVCLS